MAIEWHLVLVAGSQAEQVQGNAGTAASSSNYDVESFAGPQTLILGTLDPLEAGEMARSGFRHRARWTVQIPGRHIARVRRAWLLIGCERAYGGLHSPKFDEVACIRINGQWKDRILLRTKPLDHSDYFCLRPLDSRVPRIPPFSNFETVYGWPLSIHDLDAGGLQQVEIEVGPHSLWDIDYLGIAFGIERLCHVFVSYSRCDEEIARNLHRRLVQRSKKVWIDLLELGAGESILEVVQAAIDDAVVVAALISTSSIRSRWVQTELRLAESSNGDKASPKVIPIILDKSKIPRTLAGRRFLEMRGPRRKYSAVADEIVRAVEKASAGGAQSNEL